MLLKSLLNILYVAPSSSYFLPYDIVILLSPFNFNKLFNVIIITMHNKIINKNIIKYEITFDNEIITMTYSNNMYTFNYKEDDKVIYTGTITIDRNDNNITTYFNTTYITDKENIKTNIVIKTSDTLNIELFDTTNSININDISDKEMNNILNNILNNDAVKSILNNEEVSNYIKEKNA